MRGNTRKFTDNDPELVALTLILAAYTEELEEQVDEQTELIHELATDMAGLIESNKRNASALMTPEEYESIYEEKMPQQGLQKC